MLESIRESSQGLVAKTILGFIILTFAVAGIGSYSNSADTSVAQVNGEAISQADFDKAYQSQRNRMAQQFGDMFETLSADPSYMANFRQGVLDNLINERLVDQNNAAMGIRVSDQRLKETIRNMPEFHSDGVFDNNRYLAVINQAGFFQSSDFRDYLRVEMVRRQLTTSLVASEFSLPYQEEMQTALQTQQRDIRFATINAAQFKDGVEITEDEIKTYYLANQAQFQNQERVKVDYIALDVKDIAKSVEVSDADVTDYYNNNISSYKDDEKRRVSHILIEFGDDKAASQAKAEGVVARLASGETFDALAKELSDDTFSGENGGDLEWLERGVMEPAFEEVAFSLANVGDVSDIVETSFGFHLITLTDVVAEQVKTLAEVKDELFEKVSREKAEERFYELQQEMARLSFEFPDSLEDAAGAVNVAVKTSDWLTRSGNVAPFNDQKVLEAMFSDIVTKEQLNSDLIEVSDELAVVLRVNEYQAATVKPQSEVAGTITEILTASKLTEKAQSVASDLLAQFKAGTDITEGLTAVGAAFEAKAGLSRFGGDVDSALVKEAFVLPHPVEGTISASMVSLSNGDLALVELQAVKAGESANIDPNLAQQQTSQLAQSAYLGYINLLKENAEITQKAVSELPVGNQF